MDERAKGGKFRKRRWILGALAALFGGAALFYGPVIADLSREGILQGLLSKPQERAYLGDSEDNLRALYLGMKLYHDSEGAFPEAESWMDAIGKRVKTSDMSEDEAAKKLIRPDLRGQPDRYGYAMNVAMAGMYLEDVKDPSRTPLLFESRETGRNAAGDPVSDALSAQALAIAVDGTILRP